MPDSVLKDVRFALREFQRAPGAITIALIAMALGIGGVTAVFSVVDRMMLRPLPYKAADRLTWIGMRAPIAPDEFLLEADYGILRDRNTVFEGVAAMSRTNDCDLNEREPLRLACTQATHELLPLLGVNPILGRHFTPEEDSPRGPRAAMLSFGFWRSRFGSDPAVLDRTLVIDGHPVRIVAVLPPEFEQPNFAKADVLLSWQLNIAPGVQRSFLMVFGRLKPGVEPEAARAALMPLYAEMQTGIPPSFRGEVSFHVTGMQERQTRDYRTASWLLLGCVAGLLLIACANVANLLLARGAARRQEFAVRAALGAGRTRIIQQSLTESLLLAVCGGIAGVLLALALLRALKGWVPEGAVRIQQASLDGRVLLFALGLTCASAILFGMVPALRAGSVASLQRARSIGFAWSANQWLMAAQIGLSVVLLSSAATLLHSVWKMERVPLGMTANGIHAVRLQVGTTRYRTRDHRSAFFAQALERLSRIPGTRNAALADSVPLYGGTRTTIFSQLAVDGRPPESGRPTQGMVVWRAVTPEYLSTLGIPVVRGRAFNAQDWFGTEDLCIVDEVLARRLFPGEDPLGKRIRIGGNGTPRTVIGIARPAKNAGLMQADDPEFYALWRIRSDFDTPRAHILLRSDADPAELASFVRAEIARIDPTVPVSLTTMEGNLARLTERPRIQTRLLSVFALAGLILAAAGQFGLVSYIVTERTSEIGIRMALGATPQNVLGLIGSRVGLWTAAGALAGIAVSVWLASYVEPLVSGVTPRDPLIALSVLALLSIVSVAAAFPPTLRAMRVDPASALRHEQT